MLCQREGCSNEVHQPPIGRPRKFCSPKCTRDHWNAQKPTKGIRVVEDHALSEIDEEAKTGVCRHCGPVRVYPSKRGDGTVRYRCAKKVRAQQSRARYKAGLDPDEERYRRLISRGIKDFTVQQLQELVDAAGGCCQLCGREAALHVDHDHVAGYVRGLLCATCNTGLGKLGDTVERLEAVVDYLRLAERAYAARAATV